MRVVAFAVGLAGCAEGGGSAGDGEGTLIGTWDCDGPLTRNGVVFDASVHDIPEITAEQVDISICEDAVPVAGDPADRLEVTADECMLAVLHVTIREAWFQLDDVESMHLLFRYVSGGDEWRAEEDCVPRDE